MAAPKGNQYWKLAKNPGKSSKIKSPEELRQKANAYFEWCASNPVQNRSKTNKQGSYLEITRPFTKIGVALYCGYCSWESLSNLKNQGEDFEHLIKQIESIIYDQKYTYAAVGVFQQNIIARELGLMEKAENQREPDIYQINITGIDD